VVSAVSSSQPTVNNRPATAGAAISLNKVECLMRISFSVNALAAVPLARCRAPACENVTSVQLTLAGTVGGMRGKTRRGAWGRTYRPANPVPQHAANHYVRRG